jgi:uncharacterized protein YdeI (YjbR/CyaY-like superfamily)
MIENAEILEFKNRNDYRNWLKKNHKQENGIWIVFIKGNKLFSANDALEESMCFGWIDGLMKSIDGKTYKKYFSKRKDIKKWSVKNIAIHEKLLKNGLMTNAGIDVFKAEKNEKKVVMDMNEKIELLKKELKPHKDILSLFESKSPSRQKQFAGFYCEAKTQETRKKRIGKIIEALSNNYNGMLY